MLKIIVTIKSLVIVKKFIKDRKNELNLKFVISGFQLISLMFINTVDKVIRMYM